MYLRGSVGIRLTGGPYILRLLTAKFSAHFIPFFVLQQSMLLRW